MHFLTSGMFQLTGWLQRLQHDSEPAPSVRLQLYFKCLEWYNGFFAIQSWHRADRGTSGYQEVRLGVDDNSNRDLAIRVKKGG